jgi:hypothetical protein
VVGIFGLILNGITVYLLTQWNSIPPLGSSIIPMMYFLGLIQVIWQRLYMRQMDEFDQMQTIFVPLLKVVTISLGVFALFRGLYALRKSIAPGMLPFLAVSDLFISGVTVLIVAMCAAIMLGLMISYAIKYIRGIVA